MSFQSLSFAEKRDWLRLTRTATVGPVAFRDLLRRYKSADAALDALPSLVRNTGRAAKLSIPDIEDVEAEMEASEASGVQLIAACEAAYPPFLKAINPPPPIISVIGDTDLLSRPCAAIVGSRNASAIGLRFARQIAHELGEAGFTIVSGLARGIDASAHSGSVDTGTAAVLGGGADHIYPRQNTELYHEIAQRGVIVSESPLGHRATARDFPRRNRIISGLAQGVIVIEAAERSGTLITARYALEQNREVMAAPGSPLDPRTKGCNRLIRQGAALVENTQDILDVLANVHLPFVEDERTDYTAPQIDWDEVQSDIDAARTQLLGLCSPTPTPRDEIIRQSDLPYPIAAAALMEMELAGMITVEGDGRLALC